MRPGKNNWCDSQYYIYLFILRGRYLHTEFQGVAISKALDSIPGRVCLETNIFKLFRVFVVTSLFSVSITQVF